MSSKLISKLVKAAGGWENLLYETLKEVCQEVGNHGFTGSGEDAVNDAQDVLEAYKAQDVLEKLKPHVEISPPEIPPLEEIQRDTAFIKPIDHVHSKVEDTSAKKEDVELKQRVAIPKTFKVPIDKDIGSSQGELPLPANYIITDREQLQVATMNGMTLATSAVDGQIKDVNVSGHVSVTGKYRLVFTQATLGAALIRYHIIERPASE